MKIMARKTGRYPPMNTFHNGQERIIVFEGFFPGVLNAEAFMTVVIVGKYDPDAAADIVMVVIVGT